MDHHQQQQRNNGEELAALAGEKEVIGRLTEGKKRMDGAHDGENAISSANGAVDWQPGDKAVVHFKTVDLQSGAVLDDSRTMHLGPFELRIGKEFLLKQWEAAIQTMKVGECARFKATPHSVMSYPQFGRVYRDASKKKHAEAHGQAYHSSSHSCCAHMAEDDDNKDLFELDKFDLAFEFELLRVEKAESFEKELWEMEVDEKIATLPSLKEAGNKLFKEKNYELAKGRYTRALAILEGLKTAAMAVEGLDRELVREARLLMPTFLSNLAACELNLKNYPAVIKYTSMGIDEDANNPKLFFRRAKAHYERGRDLDKALADVQTAEELAPGDAAIQKLKTQVLRKQKQQTDKDKKMYKNMF